MIRQAISPRLAIRIRLNIPALLPPVDLSSSVANPMPPAPRLREGFWRMSTFWKINVLALAPAPPYMSGTRCPAGSRVKCAAKFTHHDDVAFG